MNYYKIIDLGEDSTDEITEDEWTPVLWNKLPDNLIETLNEYQIDTVYSLTKEGNIEKVSVIYLEKLSNKFDLSKIKDKYLLDEDNTIITLLE